MIESVSQVIDLHYKIINSIVWKWFFKNDISQNNFNKCLKLTSLITCCCLIFNICDLCKIMIVKGGHRSFSLFESIIYTSFISYFKISIWLILKYMRGIYNFKITSFEFASTVDKCMYHNFIQSHSIKMW